MFLPHGISLYRGARLQPLVFQSDNCVVVDNHALGPMKRGTDKEWQLMPQKAKMTSPQRHAF